MEKNKVRDDEKKARSAGEIKNKKEISAENNIIAKIRMGKNITEKNKITKNIIGAENKTKNKMGKKFSRNEKMAFPNNESSDAKMVWKNFVERYGK